MNTVLISFQYDALGKRITKRAQNQLIEYTYSGHDIIEETQSNINPTTQAKTKKELKEYTYGMRGTDDIISVTITPYTRVKKLDIAGTPNRYYYEKDHLGSVVRITSSTGAIVDQYSYTVFLKPYMKNASGVYKPMNSIKSNIGNTRLYTGREYDRETGLYYLRARHYDPIMGRFIQEDPIGTKDDINLYRYVANNPMKYVDRFGLEKLLLGAIYNAKSIQINLVGRALKGPGRIFGNHTFIQITTMDNFGDMSAYSVGGYDKGDDILRASFNDDNDIGWPGTKEYQAIITPNGLTDKQFATNIVNEALLYNQEPKGYELFSADDGNDTEGNCHNFSTTMLMRAGNYSSDLLSTVQDFNPSGLNPGLGEYFMPVCTQ